MTSAGGSKGSGWRPPHPETIDHYRVTRRIGRGGQGDVYLAHDPHLDLDVAIKVLPHDAEVDDFLDRFKVEARTAVRLTAPNVVRVYNFNPNYPYLVMEYCGDGDLNDRIKCRRRWSLREQLGLVRQICGGLMVAHEHSPPILHRDLKPGNVLFQGATPKVADFGLAKVLGGTSGLTATRGMMGTVSYASPEQLKDASSVDHRADLWSIGVILYELLTYTRPFEGPGDDYVNVAIKVRMEPPRTPSFELPDPVTQLLDRALQKDPEHRFQSAREFARALAETEAAVPDAQNLLFPPQEALNDLDRLAEQTAQHLDSGSSEQAERVVEQMRERALNDSLTRYWSLRVKSDREEVAANSETTLDSEQQRKAKWLEERLHSIQGMIGRREFRDARRVVGELLIHDPDNTLIQQHIQKIHDEEGRLTRELNEAHAAAAGARAKDDFERVLEIWKALDQRYPEFGDVRAELAVAERELAIELRRRARAEVDRRAQDSVSRGDLDAAVSQWDEYLASHEDDAKGQATRTTLVGRRDAQKKARELARREKAESEAREEAERVRAELAERLAEQRDRLERLVDRAADILERAEDETDEAAVLTERLQGAVAMLCADPAQDGGEAVVARMGQTVESLAHAIGTAAAAFREAAPVRQEEPTGVETAEAAIAALRADKPAAELLAAIEKDFRAAREKQQPAARKAAAMATIAARAEAARLALRWERLAALAAARNDAARWPAAGGAELVARATDILRNKDVGAALGSETLVSRLCKGTEARRNEIRAAAEEAGGLWKSALAEWQKAPKREKSKAAKESFKKLEARSRAAQSGCRTAELLLCASQLRRLVASSRVGAAWERHQAAIERLEGEGSEQSKAAPEAGNARRALAEYRRALAGDDHSKLADLAAAMDEIEPQADMDEPAAEALEEVPLLTARQRRFNERYDPDTLERFDDTSDALEEAQSEADRKQHGADLAELHRRLLRPPPLWKGPLPFLLLVLIVTPLIYFWMSLSSPDEDVSVTLLSLAGEVQVDSVVHAGAESSGLSEALRRIDERPVRAKLEPGAYALQLADGRRLSFSVPGPDPVVIPAADADPAGALMEALQLPDLLVVGEEAQ